MRFVFTSEHTFSRSGALRGRFVNTPSGDSMNNLKELSVISTFVEMESQFIGETLGTCDIFADIRKLTLQ